MLRSINLRDTIDQIFQVYLIDRANYYDPGNTIRELSKLSIFRLVTQDLPQAIGVNVGLDLGRYKVSGSIGQGNITTTPHVCLFDLKITNSPSDGYYIAFLFNSKMSKVYLTLTQSWTMYEERFGAKDGKGKIAEVTKFIQNNYLNRSSFGIDRIQLDGNNKWGDKYELGTIFSKQYDRDNLPDDDELTKDLDELLSVYFEIYEWVGKDILSIESINLDNSNITRRGPKRWGLSNSLMRLTQLPEDRRYKSEFVKQYSFKASDSERYVYRRHGLVVDAIHKAYRMKGRNTGNQQQDLFFIDELRKTVEIFEVKTSSDLQSIFTAVGQLILYGMSFSLNGYEVSLRLVCRLEDEVKVVENYLEEYRIKLIRYHWVNDEPKFSNLD